MSKYLFGFLQKLLELDTVEKKRSLIVNMSNPATQNLPSNTNDVQQQAHSGKFITFETLAISIFASGDQRIKKIGTIL